MEEAASFGVLNEGKYTLTNAIYQLTQNIDLDGYLYVPSGVSAVIELQGHTLDRRVYDAVNDISLSDEESGTESGSAIVNEGTLTIRNDSNDTGETPDGGGDAGEATQGNEEQDPSPGSETIKEKPKNYELPIIRN